MFQNGFKLENHSKFCKGLEFEVVLVGQNYNISKCMMFQNDSSGLSSNMANLNYLNMFDACYVQMARWENDPKFQNHPFLKKLSML